MKRLRIDPLRVWGFTGRVDLSDHPRGQTLYVSLQLSGRDIAFEHVADPGWYTVEVTFKPCKPPNGG